MARFHRHVLSDCYCSACFISIFSSPACLSANMNQLLPTTNGDISPPKPTTTRKLIVFSGGSAANNLVDVFNEVINNNACSLTYLIPISDNGGSSSELIRVFGGPGIGDVRSEQLFSCWQLAICLSMSHGVSTGLSWHISTATFLWIAWPISAGRSEASAQSHELRK